MERITGREMREDFSREAEGGREAQDALSGEEFVALVKRDRERAFEELVRKYRGEIYDLCARIGGSRTEADDLTQDTFLKAYENLASFRGDASPRTWLYRIAHNRSVTFTRRLKRWRMTRGPEGEDLPELPELTTDPDDRGVETRDLARRAQRAVAQLPPKQRTAVVLRTTREMPYAEIAEVMGTSLSTAKTNVHHGLKKVRAWLEEEGI